MSERFPVGTSVRVANNGLGHTIRREHERVGEFSGTVMAVNGPEYRGIPEVCVESPTGERRVILVGDLEMNPDAGRMSLEEALSDAYPEPAPAVKVAIRYVDGTEEIVSNIPTDTIAVGIFAEACGNDRVANAELVRGDGTLAALWPLPDLPRVTPRPGTCGRHGSRDVVMALDLTEHPACGRRPGHPGRHNRMDGSQPWWGDNECLPLDSGR